MNPQGPKDWQLDGTGPMTDAQRRMLNAVCSDLAKGIDWFGNRLNKDDWRHVLTGTIRGWRMIPGIDRGQGARGMVMLGGSSLSLSKSSAAEAITCGLQIGDHPEDQGLKSPRVQWCDKVLLGLGLTERDLAA